jgi:hypothetical protein
MMNTAKVVIAVPWQDNRPLFLKKAVEAALKAYREHQAAVMVDRENANNTPLLVG